MKVVSKYAARRLELMTILKDTESDFEQKAVARNLLQTEGSL